MAELLEAPRRLSAQDIAAANDKVRAWIERRLQRDAVDISRLYRNSRDKLAQKIQWLYDLYLTDNPNYQRAKRVGALGIIHQQIDLDVETLTDEIGQVSLAHTVEKLHDWDEAMDRFLKPKLEPAVEFKALPVSTQQVLGELTTSLVGGGTFYDRVFHVQQDLKDQLKSDLRASLINGENFDQLRDRFLKAFGVDKLTQPKGPAYGSVKLYTNEARRQWSALMFRQARASGGVPVWLAKLPFDERTTPGCLARHGKRIEDLNEAPPRHFNAFAPDTMVRGDFIAGYGLLYSGPVVCLKTRSGKRLTVTPNHPVLTRRGMLPAHQVRKGDDLFAYRVGVEEHCASVAPARFHSPDDAQQRPASIEQAFRAMAETYGVVRERRIAEDFHCDAQFGHSDIDIVVADRELWDRMAYLSGPDNLSDFALEQAQLTQTAHPCGSDPRFVVGSVPSAATAGRDGDYDQPDVALLAPPNQRRTTSVSRLDTVLLECLAKAPTRDSVFSGELILRGAGLVSLDDVVQVEARRHHGLVYDVQTRTTCIIANGLVTSQCRCEVGVFPPGVELEALKAEAETRLEAIGYTPREAMLEEAGWTWGHERLQPTRFATRTRFARKGAEGVQYAGIPWRKLPGMAGGGVILTLAWTSDPAEAASTDRPDCVLLRRRGATVEAKTWRGWTSLRPPGAIVVEVTEGWVVDGPDTGPLWDERRRRLSPTQLQRWPAMAQVSFPLSPTGRYAVALVGEREAEQFAIRGQMAEDTPWRQGSISGVLAEFTDGGLGVRPHIVVAFPGEQPRIRLLVDLETGNAIYSDEPFGQGLKAPYLRAAAVVFEPDGQVWAVRPRGLPFWALPGGHLEPGESPAEAAVRELAEETGVRARPMRVLGNLYRPWSTTVIVACQRYGALGSPYHTEEIDAVAAVPLDQLAADERAFLLRRAALGESFITEAQSRAARHRQLVSAQ